MRHEYGQEFKKMRAKARVTQVQAAKSLGYSSPQFISNIERGHAMIPVGKVKKMSTVYKVAPREIVRIMVKAREADWIKAVEKPKRTARR